MPKKLISLVMFMVLLMSAAACAAQPAATMAPVAAATQVPATEAVQPTLEQPTIEATAPAAPEITVTDAMGREVTFEQTPQRIVLAGKALFMIADAIYLFPEAGKSIVALGSTEQGSGNFIPMVDASFSDKISLDSNAGAEQIAAAQPDCVILKSSNVESLGKPLEAIGIPVVYLDFETPEQYDRDLTTLGLLFQNPERAKELISYYKDGLEKITSVTSALKDDEKPRTLILYYNEKDGAIAFNVPPMSWMQTLMVEAAGGMPVWKDANPGKGWTKVSLEQVAAWDPDAIFIVAYFNPVTDVVAKLKEDPQWQALRAVKENKLYAFAGDVYSWDQPDTRWLLGTTWLAGKLNPQLFPDLDLKQEALTFYKELYSMDDSAFEKNILPMLRGE